MQGSPGRNHEGNVELQHFLQVVFCILHFFSAFFAYFNSAISVKKKEIFSLRNFVTKKGKSSGNQIISSVQGKDFLSVGLVVNWYCEESNEEKKP